MALQCDKIFYRYRNLRFFCLYMNKEKEYKRITSLSGTASSVIISVVISGATILEDVSQA